ncbi:MAG TPA: ABC transporter ATP-binding protein [Chitinophagales bacterium]|nr:ABC transporter ATP-binding protein [Chitinophagales bacterium]HNL08122.1 ABC transporter ATP-binding protein [Chitinophagales bacterium]
MPPKLYLYSMIIGKGIKKSYQDLVVLKSVDIQIEKSEIVSIVGASGAGKSTLLHILGLLDQADAGEIEINGRSIQGLSAKQLALFRNRHIGFVFQFHHLLPEFTALENVCMPAYLGNRNEKTSQKNAQQLLERLGLGNRLHHKPNQLSGGEQQRVAVARALINQPDVVFADEPSGNLDSDKARELHQLFFDLRKDLQQTFVIVTHNEELANMSDRKIVMRDGQVV